MDLTTSYLGMQLPHPFMPGASPLVDDLSLVRRLEDAGAAAIVMHSLFEEQLASEQLATHEYMNAPAESFAEALSYMPSPDEFKLGPEEYLQQLQNVKQAVDIPVIASLNGTTLGGWLDYARLLAEAGADAIELNVYQLATDPEESGQALEQRTIEMLRAVKQEVQIPVAIKLSPFHTAMAHFARELDNAGANGMIVFNRFYQADIDIEELEVERALRLSHPSELLLRLTWLAVLSGHVKASLAVAGGVHTAIDAIKAVMAGAHVVQVVSALLRHGPRYLGTMREEMMRWMEKHEYESLRQMQGSMNLTRCPDPKAFERANYMQILQSWKGYVPA